MVKREEVDVIDAEFTEIQPTEEKLSFKEPWNKRRKRKKPRGTRKKDYPSFTPEARETIIQMATMGVPVDVGAYYANVTPETAKRWLAKGKECTERLAAGEKLERVEQDFVQFTEDYNRAKATPVVNLVSIIMRLARQDGKLAMDMLKQLAPEHFGDKGKIDINVSGGINHQHTLKPGQAVVKELTDEQLRQLRSGVKQLPEGSTYEEND